DRIALIQGGEILAVDTPEGIADGYPEPLYAVRSNEIPRLLADLRKYPNTLSCFTFGEYLHLSFRDDHPGAATDMKKYAEDHHHQHVEVHPVKPTIEDCFMRLLKEN